jgi:hypothetical protein
MKKQNKKSSEKPFDIYSQGNLTQQYLHKNMIINSDKQNSAQGSVFYVKQTTDPSRELVLKIYKNEDMKSYLKEIAVFKRLDEMMKRTKSN